MRTYVKVLSYIWPSRAIALLVKLFTKPRVDRKFVLDRYNRLNLFEHGQTNYIQFHDEQIFTYTEGEPKVLLVSGWESSAHRFQTLMDRLREEEFGFLYFDLPGQGKSEGKRNDAIKTAKIINLLIQQHPSINTIIAHSFGGGAAYISLTSDHQTVNQLNKVVTVGSPTRYQSMIEPFFTLLDVPSKIENRFTKELSKYIDSDFLAYDWKKMQVDSNTSIHLFHDREDHTVPVTDTERMEGKHTIHLSTGLGHRKIMHDPEIINQMIKIIQTS